MQNLPSYVVVTPVRDEEKYLLLTIESMVRQTIIPTEWVIVNDGSTDKTGTIADEAAANYPWIRVVHRPNRGFRQAGGGVVEAFNAGYQAIACKDWRFIVKLDGDLSFAAAYFADCFARFEDSTLGIAGGGIYNMIDGKRIFEQCPIFHVRGASKIYSRPCWDAIGGFWPAPGWDKMDEVKAQRLGWTTKTFPELELTHHRYTGAADGTWKTLRKNGRANYICGYHPLFMIAKCIGRLPRKPYVLGAAALFYGFISGYFNGTPQVDDRATIAYLRQQQLYRLAGKSTIWR